jgi:hypothetical protein
LIFFHTHTHAQKENKNIFKKIKTISATHHDRHCHDNGLDPGQPPHQTSEWKKIKRRQIYIISTSTKHTYSRKVLVYNKRTNERKKTKKQKKRFSQIIKMKKRLFFSFSCPCQH